MASYKTFDVMYEHTTDTSDNVRQNRITITIYGESEFKIVSEIKRQRPGHTNVDILDITER